MTAHVTAHPEPAAILRQIPYFETLAPEEVEELASAAHLRLYRASEVIFSQGQPAAGLWCVAAGRVKAVRFSPQGRELIIKFFEPYETFGEVGALEGGENPSNAIAAVDSRILLVPRQALAPLLRRHPEVDTRIMRAMAQKLRYAMSRFEQATLFDVRTRLAAFLLAQRLSGQTVCRLSQEEVASMLGTVRQVVGRALAELQSAGAIRVRRGAIEILRPEVLQDAVQLL